MEANSKLKIVITEVLLLSLIGFVIYVLAIVASFMGCCLGVTNVIFDQIVLILSISGIVAFGVCSYFTCFKHKSANR